MRTSDISRRSLVGGGIACIACTLTPSPANAFVPAVMTAINSLVVLWQGIKMAEEVYQRFFAGRREKVESEVSRFCRCQNVIINNYYNFSNPYRIRNLHSAEPGCDYLAAAHQKHSATLSCGTPEGAVSIPAGCIVALDRAVGELSSGYGAERAFAYTRPIRYIARPEPWRPVGFEQYQSVLRYYSPLGTVGLQWSIIDRRARLCRGEYVIRDDRTLRKIATGATNQFYY